MLVLVVLQSLYKLTLPPRVSWVQNYYMLYIINIAFSSSYWIVLEAYKMERWKYIRRSHLQRCLFKIDFKAQQTGASLVAQWLRICLPMQGTQVRALVREDPTCRGAPKPVRHNYWSPCSWSLCSATREATAVRSPRQLEKARAQPRKTQRSQKINK